MWSLSVVHVRSADHVVRTTAATTADHVATTTEVLAVMTEAQEDHAVSVRLKTTGRTTSLRCSNQRYIIEERPSDFIVRWSFFIPRLRQTCPHQRRMRRIPLTWALSLSMFILTFAGTCWRVSTYVPLPRCTFTGLDHPYASHASRPR